MNGYTLLLAVTEVAKVRSDSSNSGNLVLKRNFAEPEVRAREKEVPYFDIEKEKEDSAEGS